MTGFIAGAFQKSTGATFNLTLPAGAVQGGEVLVIAQNGSSTAITDTIAGSTLLLSAAASNMYVRVLSKVLTATDITNGFLAVTSSTSSHDFWILAYDTTITGFDSANTFPLTSSFFGTRGGVSQTTVTAPAVTPNSGGDQVILISCERTTATGTTVSSISQGTQDYYNEDTANTNCSVLAARFAGPAAGVSTGTSTITYSGASGNAIAFLLPMTAIPTASASLSLSASGAGGTAGSGSLSLSGTAQLLGTASLSLSGSSAAQAVGTASGSLSLSAKAYTPALTWVKTRAGGGQLVAHRDGTWAVNGEETLEGYNAAALWHSAVAMEISLWDTTDGVYPCSHDQTTSRVFTGTNQTITAIPWSTLSPNGPFVTTGRPVTLVGGNVMRRLEEILDAFPNRIFVIDNKRNTNHTALINILEAHASGRWIAKAPSGSTAWLNAASAKSVPVWSYFYPADLPNLATILSSLATAVANGSQIIFGLGDFSTTGVTLPTQADSDTFFSFVNANGIMSWAHILNTSAQKTTADTYATNSGGTYDGYMISNVTAVIPTDTNFASGSLSLSASGADAAPGIATGSLSLSGSAIDQARGTAVASLSLTGTIQATVIASASISLSAAAASLPPGQTIYKVGKVEYVYRVGRGEHVYHVGPPSS